MSALRALLPGFVLSLVPDEALNRLLDKAKALDILGPVIGQTGLNWPNFVKRFVYAPFRMNEEIGGNTLVSNRNSWAADKDIVIAAAVHSNPAVVSKHGDAYLLSRVASRIPGNRASTLPMSFVSKSNPLGPIAKAHTLESLPGTSIPASLELIHTLTDEDGQFLSSRGNNPIAFNNTRANAAASRISVIDAAVASSSFGSIAAAPLTTDQFIPIDQLRFWLANIARELAPPISFSEMSLSGTAFSPTGRKAAEILDKAKDNQLARLADGGYADNTSAANLLRHIQEKEGTTSGFEMTVFMNSSDDPLTGIRMKTDERGGLTSFLLPSDVGALFGNKSGNHNDGLNVVGPEGAGYSASPKIFKEEAFFGTGNQMVRPKFNIGIPFKGLEFKGFQLNVETVSNQSYGIIGGQRGKLNLFVASNTNSEAGPISPGVLNAYDDNFAYYRDTIANGLNGRVFGFIKDAFDLAPD